jgi:hypothetical protein
LLESPGIYFLESKFQHGEKILDYLLLLEKGLASANFPDEGAPTQTSKHFSSGSVFLGFYDPDPKHFVGTDPDPARNPNPSINLWLSHQAKKLR